MKTTKNFFFNLTALVGTTIIIFSSCGDNNGFEKQNEPQLSTFEVTEITLTTAMTGGNITNDGGATVTARGVCWSTGQTPTIDDSKTEEGTGAGSFTSKISGLERNTQYYVRAYATNSGGTGYGSTMSFTTPSFGTIIVDVINPITGKTWMDRNLGASRAATSSTDAESFGDLYQWGRGTDGHEKRNSQITTILSSSDSPGNGSFILSPNSPGDWRSPKNDNLWQGVNGVNNPCPPGYRPPTEAELDAERQSWSSDDAAGAFASPIKFPMAGARDYTNGLLIRVGTSGYYWNNTNDFYPFGKGFAFDNTRGASIFDGARSIGASVRCIKD